MMGGSPLTRSETLISPRMTKKQRVHPSLESKYLYINHKLHAIIEMSDVDDPRSPQMTEV